MLPLSFLTTPSLTSSLPPFYSQSHDHLVSLLQITRVCLQSVLGPSSVVLLISFLLQPCLIRMRWFTNSLVLWQSSFHQVLRGSHSPALTQRASLLSVSPTHVFLNNLLVRLACVFQKHRWGQCRQSDFESLKSKEQNKTHGNCSLCTHRSLGQG